MALTHTDGTTKKGRYPAFVVRALGELRVFSNRLGETADQPGKFNKIARDLVIFSCIILVVYLIAGTTDALEGFISWSARFEALEIDEIVIVLAAMSLLFGIYSVRRLREVGRENLQRLETEAVLYRRNRELAALFDATSTINSDLKLEPVLQTVAEKVTEIAESDGCAISIWDRERDDLVTLVDYSRKFPDATEAKGTCYALKDYPASRQVLVSGQPLILNVHNRNADPAELAYMKSKDILGLLMLPLIVHDRVIGLLEVYQEVEAREYTQRDVNLLQSLSSHASISIENARLLEDAQQRLRQTQALRAIDNAIIGSLDIHVTLDVFLYQVESLLDVDAACVLVFEQDSQKLVYTSGRGFRTSAFQQTRLSLGEGCAGVAALERRIFAIPDLHENSVTLACSPHFAREGFVTYYAVPLVANTKVRGVLEVFQRQKFDPPEDWLDFLQALAAQAAIAVDNATLFMDLQRSNVELSLAYDATIEGWSRALDLRDHETEGHTQRVVAMAVRLAHTMGIEGQMIEHIRRGALLHDIGKMGVADEILHKAGPLDDAEWEIMRKHPVYAYEMLYPIAHLRPALDIPYCHHEKWDGTGYPRGLKGEQIPLAARLFAIIDVFDALRSDRPYRAKWSEEKTLAYIQGQSGKHFDPDVVAAFIKLLSQ